MTDSSTQETQRRFATYDDVADEYYDRSAHPTCFNFNRLSRLYIEDLFPDAWGEVSVIEVGAGDSAVAALLHSRGYSKEGLVIPDASASMLDHSGRWREEVAEIVVCPAQD